MMAINGVDYFSAHAQGLVTVHGYLRRFFASRRSKKPEDCDKDKLITQLASSIHTAAIRLGNAREGSEVAAKFAFCLSPELSRSWKQAGVDIDVGLRQVVDETLARYSRFAMRGTELGYAVGIHHDKQHVHAHVFLMRRAGNGKLLRLSNRHEVTENGITQKHDYLNILIQTANTVLREYQNKLTKAKVNLGNTQSLSADIERWINLATYDRIPAGIKGTAAEEWAITEKEHLRQSPPEVLIGTLDVYVNGSPPSGSTNTTPCRQQDEKHSKLTRDNSARASSNSYIFTISKPNRNAKPARSRTPPSKPRSLSCNL